MLPQLIERINQTLGFRAVGAIRLLQAPLQPARAKRRPQPPPIPAEKAAAPQTPLERALARMKQGVKMRNQGEVTSS